MNTDDRAGTPLGGGQKGVKFREDHFRPVPTPEGHSRRVHQGLRLIIAADLAQVLNGTALDEYAKPELFFANTYPTEGLKKLLANVFQRLSTQGGAAAIFRLDTQYGDGKTHALIALAHAARSMQKVPNAAEFLPPSLVPAGPVRLAAFDGENTDPGNGRALDTDRGHSVRRSP